MKHPILVSVLLAMFVAFYLGCGGGGSSNFAPPPPSQVAPAITSASSTTFTVGTVGSFIVTATGTPVPTITELGALPTGVTFAAGILGGTRMESGSFPITFTASNGVLPNAVQSFVLTILPVVTSVSVSCTPASVETGQTSQCTATVTGTGTYSSTVTWSASAGTINSSGLFTAPVTANTVTITATSTEDATKVGSTIVTVVSTPSNASLAGVYVLEFHDDNATEYSFVGKMTSDGNGNVTGIGVAWGWGNGNNFTGTYQVDSGGDGHISTDGGIDLYFSLDEAGSGRLVTLGWGVKGIGKFVKQDEIANLDLASFSGSWVFSFNGHVQPWTVAAAVGILSVDQHGTVSGSEDFVEGTGLASLSKASFLGTATYNNGQGTITTNSSLGTSSFAFYPISANKLAIVSNDSVGDQLTGWAEKQQGTFSTSSLAGSYVFVLSGLEDYGAIQEVGRVVFDGSGGISGIADISGGGSVFAAESLSGSYSIDSNGIGKVTVQGSSWNDTIDFYMASSDEAYVIDTAGGVVIGRSFLQQGIPFSNSSLNGTYAFLVSGTNPTGVFSSVGIMRTEESGSIFFAFESWVVSSVGTSCPFYDGTNGIISAGTVVQPIQANGRGVVGFGQGAGNFAIYLIDPSHAVMVGIDPNETQSGTFSKQF